MTLPVTRTRVKGHPPEVMRSMRAVLLLWDELCAREGPFHFEMRGASMWPAAPEGSLLAIVPCPSAALVAGDLVTFRRGDAIITHRVVDVGADGRVLSWGDSLLRPDAPIPPADVLGRATVVRRGPALMCRRLGWVAARRAGAGLVRLVAKGGSRRPSAPGADVR